MDHISPNFSVLFLKLILSLGMVDCSSYQTDSIAHFVKSALGTCSSLTCFYVFPSINGAIHLIYIIFLQGVWFSGILKPHMRIFYKELQCFINTCYLLCLNSEFKKDVGRRARHSFDIGLKMGNLSPPVLTESEQGEA